ncbi:hypothetical protein IE53DRAFT_76550 [Violaceomyces palustris]|uniref:Uncharacterized protein n=1 Tax=Violaceomyces palustris TaxID=1673888 RepID=A0ACD0P7D5_9BASI|nr:hypothetical protein IE53DRAFT_76550 [Violaceomyces palustris]
MEHPSSYAMSRWDTGCCSSLNSPRILCFRLSFVLFFRLIEDFLCILFPFPLFLLLFLSPPFVLLFHFFISFVGRHLALNLPCSETNWNPCIGLAKKKKKKRPDRRRRGLSHEFHLIDLFRGIERLGWE